MDWRYLAFKSYLIEEVKSYLLHRRYIPSEKIGHNFHPSESCFFVINYQHWTGTSALQSFWVWGALGGFGGVCRPQNCHYCSVTNFSPGMQCFGLKQLVTLCF